MKTTLFRWDGRSWTASGGAAAPARADLVLWFASPEVAARPDAYEALRAMFPGAVVAGCSTGGEILGEDVCDSAVAAATTFDQARVRAVRADVTADRSMVEIGGALARALRDEQLKAVFLMADGTHVNGTALVEGVTGELPESVVVTGGLAGDGPDFKITRVGLDAAPTPMGVVAVGFYGESLRVGWGSAGGWEPFGPERQVTRSEGATLFELDGRPALELYKQYLGPQAAQLPGSALLFPLVIRPEPGSDYDVVRTIVGVDEERQALIFAGDVPEGWSAQLMRGSPDNLSDGAAEAARQAGAAGEAGGLALLVSCIGRKLMMGQRVVDEVESVRDVLGPIPTLGFYSYGEICPHGFTGDCTLHNQTMTITVLSEAV